MHLLYYRGNIRKGTLYKKETENDIDHNKGTITGVKSIREIGGEKEMYYVLQYIEIISFG